MKCVNSGAETMNVGMYQAAPMICYAPTLRPRNTAWNKSTVPTTLKSHTSGSAAPQRPRRATSERRADCR